ncbi:glutamate racemase [Ktedonobacter sp. SOSP1-52]|uniref:glutamate racemase n=1 Tax=Ktedonobacter sp. SOSP1-52 TaxID=2778366 RepID=UPI001915279B|nr:glutamate racemase [Ktedonobacter sp. SOSP1-52]GHO66482.1 glutamate racemase [Ktedonobacter sp. SOSP1-52]
MNVRNTNFDEGQVHTMLGEGVESLSPLARHESRGDDTHRPYAPIGVYDSGAGGLTILTELRKVLPHEDFLYYGDTKHCPYGVRSEAEIIELAKQASRFLLERGVKLIVVACNTASQAALEALRLSFPDVPFVGVVPAVKPAASLTRKGRIGVAATNQAAKSAYLQQLIEDFATGVEVYAQGCSELVTLVEKGQLQGPEVEAVLRQSLHPLLQHDIDVLVLGCTHFPALHEAIRQVVGPDVQVIDSGAAIARRTRFLLEQAGIAHPIDQASPEQGSLQVWCSGDAHPFTTTASQVLGYPVSAESSTTSF